jgi:O-succinylbenzoic acid--CoA ligase
LHGFVKHDFFLAGLRDHELGERLVMFIEDAKGELENSEDKIWESINEKLTGYENPKSIIFMEEFERTGNGKILRANTVENYVAQFDEATEEEET